MATLGAGRGAKATLRLAGPARTIGGDADRAALASHAGHRLANETLGATEVSTVRKSQPAVGIEAPVGRAPRPTEGVAEHVLETDRRHGLIAIAVEGTTAADPWRAVTWARVDRDLREQAVAAIVYPGILGATRASSAEISWGTACIPTVGDGVSIVQKSLFGEGCGPGARAIRVRHQAGISLVVDVVGDGRVGKGIVTETPGHGHVAIAALAHQPARCTGRVGVVGDRHVPRESRLAAALKAIGIGRPIDLGLGHAHVERALFRWATGAPPVEERTGIDDREGAREHLA